MNISDSILFVLPSLENENDTVYGLASFYQIEREPIYGLLMEELDSVVKRFFECDNMQKAQESLEVSLKELEKYALAKLDEKTPFHDVTYQPIDLISLLLTYQRDMLTIMKLLLLERRILVTGDSAGLVSQLVYGFANLLPHNDYSSFKTCTKIDPTWVSDAFCWPLANQDIFLPYDLQRTLEPEDTCQLIKPSQFALHSLWKDLRAKSTNIPLSSSLANRSGLPLTLFFKSYLMLPYIPLHMLDFLLKPCTLVEHGLVDRNVRGFIGGTTNVLLKDHKSLAEVVISALPLQDKPVQNPLPMTSSSQNLEQASLLDDQYKTSAINWVQKNVSLINF
ncbi:late secretory pathway protein avl9 [Cichlidogyrus casuarinus]|uniref:Late secretory pathway protein avl9 n=1 Tax=Cichlidogyrus casuarinus TaxID=1844966 RepID=A0ABD2Q8Q9_9PLAT